MDFYFKWKFWSEMAGLAFGIICFVTWCIFTWLEIKEDDKRRKQRSK